MTWSGFFPDSEAFVALDSRLQYIFSMGCGPGLRISIATGTDGKNRHGNPRYANGGAPA